MQHLWSGWSNLPTGQGREVRPWGRLSEGPVTETSQDQGLASQQSSLLSVPSPSVHRPEAAESVGSGIPARKLKSLNVSGMMRPRLEVPADPDCLLASWEVITEAGIAFSPSLRPHTCTPAEDPPSVGSMPRSFSPNSLHSFLCALAAHCAGLTELSALLLNG